MVSAFFNRISTGVVVVSSLLMKADRCSSSTPLYVPLLRADDRALASFLFLFLNGTPDTGPTA